ncbi:MAG: hypothetical protein HQL56_19550 [Magnetococcales bacterium]|nr:hypothetical protein [Magnetococcales bacterium]
MTACLSDDGTILHIHIPMQLRRRGGRKVIISPDGYTAEPGIAPTPAMPDDPIVRALLKARRWQSMLESREVATIKDLAEQEKLDPSYLARILRLNSLAPAIVEKILAGDYPDTISLRSLRDTIPFSWEEQTRRFGVAALV